jgi:hypothetical protein
LSGIIAMLPVGPGRAPTNFIRRHHQPAMKLFNESPISVRHRRRRHGEDFEVEHELLPGSELKLAMEPERDFVELSGAMGEALGQHAALDDASVHQVATAGRSHVWSA